MATIRSSGMSMLATHAGRGPPRWPIRASLGLGRDDAGRGERAVSGRNGTGTIGGMPARDELVS